MNHYIGNSGQFTRITEAPSAAQSEPEAVLAEAIPATNIANAPKKQGFALPFKLNNKITITDVILAALFFYLYTQTNDWEFLILAAALFII